MLVYMRGAGDIATGIALRLHRAGLAVVMADIAEPTCIRRTVAFCEAIRLGEACVEGVCARLAHDAAQARAIADTSDIAVVVDPAADMLGEMAPDVVVDAILAKKNLGTTIDMAPVVIGVGPGFTAGVDCHAAVETKRGHYLGRALYEGSPIANTGIPGIIGGHGSERVLRAPADGTFDPLAEVLAFAGFEVVVCDDRAEVLGLAHLPRTVERLRVDYGDLSVSVSIDARDFVVVCTAGHASDFDVLAQVLSARPRYVGCLGSKKKAAHTRARLREAGFPADAIDSIHMPVGVPIACETPEEIAVSIAAQVVDVRRSM